MSEKENGYTWYIAKKATVIKWERILRRLQETKELVNSKCGFCTLAKQVEKRTGLFRCFECDSIAKTLCEEYITKFENLLSDPLNDAIRCTDELLTKIKAMKPPSK